MEEDRKKKKRDLKGFGRKAAQTAAGAGLAVSMFFGNVFSAPKDLQGPEDIREHAAIVQVEQPSAAPIEAAAGLPAEEEKRTLRARIRAWLRSLPLSARLVMLLPLWAAGFAFMLGACVLVNMIGVPILGVALKFLIGAGLLVGLVCLGQKLIFPDVPLKRLLSKRNLAAVGIFAGVIALSGSVVGRLLGAKPIVTAAIDVGAAAAYTLFFLIFVKRAPAKKG